MEKSRVGNQYESDGKKGQRFTRAQRRILLKRYEELEGRMKPGQRLGQREIEQELADKYACDVRTIQRNLKRARQEREAVIKQEQGQIYREGTVATVAGQGKLFSIELPMRQAILHQLRVIGSRSCVFHVMVSESASTYVDAMQSNVGIFQSHGRVVQETFRLPDWYYEDKDGGTQLHLEITPLIDQYLKPQTPVEFRVGVWFTSISQ